jgi:hypothetical protein
MENLLICPISHEIFKEPVIIDDGITYEKYCILKWFNKNNTSPITGLQVSKKIIDNTIIKLLVDEFLTEHPESREKQFKPIYSFLEFKNMCITYIQDKKFYKLFDFVEFDLQDSSLNELFNNCNDEKIINHVINNKIINDNVNINDINIRESAARVGVKITIDDLGNVIKSESVDIEPYYPYNNNNDKIFLHNHRFLIPEGDRTIISVGRSICHANFDNESSDNE